MTYHYRGVVEGFYGTPWSHDARVHFFDFMQAHGLNAYIYAPKDDEFHRDNWRAPYDETALARFQELSHAAQRHGIFFTFAMSPGLDLTYSDGGEVDALEAKAQPLLALGIPSLGIFFDDVPPTLMNEADRVRYGDLGEAQADFLERVQTRLPSVHLMTVPTFYCGEPHTPYLQSLARAPLEIDIMWTGPAICSEEIRSDQMYAVADVLRRPAVLWDNYPVNDVAMIAELHIAPYRNRDGNLPVRGIYANPMSLMEASKLPLMTFADYLENPNWYSADASWRQAASTVVGPALVDALTVFAESVSISPLAPAEPQAMLDLIAPFLENRLPYIHNPAPEHLRAGTARMRDAYQQLLPAVESVPFLAAIAPWLTEYGHWIDLLEIASALIELDDDGEADVIAGGGTQQTAAQLRERIRSGLKASVDFRTVTCGDVVRNFLQELLRRSGEPLV